MESKDFKALQDEVKRLKAVMDETAGIAARARAKAIEFQKDEIAAHKASRHAKADYIKAKERLDRESKESLK